MNVRRRTLIAIGIASAVALSPIIASPASAGDGRALTKSEMMASLMKVSDLPANVRSQSQSSTVQSTPVRTTEYSTGYLMSLGPDLCFGTDGIWLTGRRPVSSARANIILESIIDLDGDVVTTMGTKNDIYNYGTPAKAQSAWRELVKKARQCNGTVTGADDGVEYVIKTKFEQTPRLLGARGFTITTDFSMQSIETPDDQVFNDQYAAYRIVGPAIERVQFERFSPDSSSVGINENRRAFTLRETNRVANRLWARWR